MSTQSHLGNGWAFPPAFMRKVNTVAMSGEEDNIKENLQILFSTLQGERVMNQQYGTNLKMLLFQNLTSEMESQMIQSIKRAVLFFEPRINLTDVTIDEYQPENGIAQVNVSYTIRTTNSRGNYVHPFHIIEGTSLRN